MNSNIEALYRIAAKPTRTIVGLMSGTSLDGLDVAVCSFTGSGFHTKLSVLLFTTIAYSAAFKAEIRKVFAKRLVDVAHLCLLNEWLAMEHAAIVKQCLQNWNMAANDVDVIASHGQTIYHAPKRLHGIALFGNGTLQIGDGDHLAVHTGIITISDFRQKHLAVGGEGAPLAVYGDYLLFSKANENRILLNIGGIANCTFLPASVNAQEVFSTDIGPGNTLMDAFCRQYFNTDFDDNSTIAKTGTVHFQLLQRLQQHSFFSEAFPKTTGPELFNLAYLARAQEGIEEIDNASVLATLNQFTANTIVQVIQKITRHLPQSTIFTSGGGLHNPLLMQRIMAQLPNCIFENMANLGVPPDAKEAVLFALLANETLSGGKQVLGNVTNGMPAVSMGKISFPY